MERVLESVVDMRPPVRPFAAPVLLFYTTGPKSKAYGGG